MSVLSCLAVPSDPIDHGSLRKRGGEAVELDIQIASQIHTHPVGAAVSQVGVIGLVHEEALAAVILEHEDGVCGGDVELLA